MSHEQSDIPQLASISGRTWVGKPVQNIHHQSDGKVVNLTSGILRYSAPPSVLKQTNQRWPLIEYDQNSCCDFGRTTSMIIEVIEKE